VRAKPVKKEFAFSFLPSIEYEELRAIIQSLEKGVYIKPSFFHAGVGELAILSNVWVDVLTSQCHLVLFM
jgi:hypothetical protein